jgi:hypothetical protein
MTTTPHEEPGLAARRQFLATAAKAAVIVPPAMTVLLSTSMASSAIAQSVSLRGNNGLGNGVDGPPPGIARQGKEQNDDPAVPGDPQYKGTGSN